MCQQCQQSSCKGNKCNRKCSPLIGSDNVYYEGEYLPNLGVQTNTSLTTILQILNAIYSGSSIIIVNMTAIAGTSITHPDFVGKNIKLIVVDSQANNKDFVKAPESDTITLTNGFSLFGGESLTIIAN